MSPKQYYLISDIQLQALVSSWCLQVWAHLGFVSYLNSLSVHDLSASFILFYRVRLILAHQFDFRKFLCKISSVVALDVTPFFGPYPDIIIVLYLVLGSE